MTTRRFILVILISAIVLIIIACSSGASNPTLASTTTLDGATLVQERCSKCHPLQRVESSRHTASEWKSIVNTMIARGAQLTSDEESVVVNYLATNFGK